MRLTRALLGNYFRRYVEREMYGENLRRTWRPVNGYKEMKTRKWFYSENRPWTDESKQENLPGRWHPRVHLEHIEEWTMFKGDVVQVLVGKDKGRHGYINSVIKERNWVYVEGLNCEYRVDEQNAAQLAVCQKSEKPLLVTTQVKLVDPSDRKVTDIEWRFTEKGERVRVSLRTGRIIPLPDEATEHEDFVLPKTYLETAKDTTNNEVTEVTFEPKLSTFNEDIMEAMGITEDRKRAKTYFY